jgi:putative transposase
MYVELLKEASVKISMDGRNRAIDNIYIERFWRTIKQQEVYLNEYSSPRETRQRIAAFIHCYNYFRPHQSLGGKTPLYQGVRPLRFEDIIPKYSGIHLTDQKIVS